MENNISAKQIARWVALGALFLIPLTPLLVANSYFFPFITGKAFYFRILVEIIVSAWVVLAMLDRAYRPRFSWIGVAVIAFVGWMFFADLFAINVAKAFWSNFERMEGWVLLIHLLGLFFATSSILRVEKKWRAWFLASLGVSLAVSAYALLQLAGVLAIHQGSTRIDATFGNSAYLAIYFLFNTFIALWLSFTERRNWLKWALISVAVLEGVLIFYTETRGAVLGIVLGLALASLLAAFTAGKQIRRKAGWAFVLILVLVSGFYLARGTSFVKNNHVLQRIDSISLSEGQTRFTIWDMALQGVAERPIVGWGQEGFNYVFNKFYNPSLYSQEQWFDRAHNAFVDWLTAGGVPAFLLYLSLFGSAIVLLWRSSELSRAERIILTSMLAGYAVHNFFVFDNLYSYIYFFVILAFIDSQISKPIERCENTPELSEANGMSYALPVSVVVAIALIWTVNISGMRVASRLIVALSPSSGGIQANINEFKKLSASPSFAGQEVREQLVSFSGSVIRNPKATMTEKKQIALLAITQMRKQVAKYPLDARGRLELSYAYRTAGDVSSALKEIQIASTLSPKKESIWIEAGALEWDLGKTKLAQIDFNKAYSLGSSFPNLATYAAAGDIVAGDKVSANKVLLGAYGTTTVDSDILASAYYRTKDWKHLIGIWKLRVQKPNASVKTWFGLAATYYASGNYTSAISTIRRAIKIYPNMKKSGDEAIAQIKKKL